MFVCCYPFDANTSPSPPRARVGVQLGAYLGANLGGCLDTHLNASAWARAGWLLSLGVVLAWCEPVHAAGRAGAIYRCPGPPAVFTSDPRLAASLHCRAVHSRNAAQGARAAGVWVARRGDAQSGTTSAPGLGAAADAPRGPDAPRGQRAAVVAVSTYGGAQSAGQPQATVPRALQSQRDKDRERILQDELTRERERLQTLTAALGQAQATGAQAEAERLRQSARRSASDLDAISREIARSTRF
jgi:hypothetical protein